MAERRTEIHFGDLSIADAGPRGLLPDHPGSARINIHWRRFTENERAADAVEVRVVVDYDLSRSILDLRRHARARLAEILEQAATDLREWKDPNDP